MITNYGCSISRTCVDIVSNPCVLRASASQARSTVREVFPFVGVSRDTLGSILKVTDDVHRPDLGFL
jgi:hypothetical protein